MSTLNVLARRVFRTAHKRTVLALLFRQVTATLWARANHFRLVPLDVLAFWVVRAAPEVPAALGAALYQVAPGSSSAQTVGPLLEAAAGRVQDLAIDSLGRLHAVVFSSQNSGVIVFDQGVFCQTVNAFDATYPFEVLNLNDNTLRPSPSTRLLPDANGSIWLFDSDGGVAQVSDTFRQGQCPEEPSNRCRRQR